MGLFKKKTDYSYYSSYSSSRRRLKVGRTVIAVIAAVVVILGIIIYFNFNRIQFLMKGYSWSTTSELVKSFDNDEEKELLSHDEMKHILKWIDNSNKVALYDEYEQFYSLHKEMNYEDIVDVVNYIFENQAPSLKSMGYSEKTIWSMLKDGAGKSDLQFLIDNKLTNSQTAPFRKVKGYDLKKINDYIAQYNTVKDSNGNILSDGDTVTIIKDLKVKGASSALKKGTKVKNIKLVEGDHNIDCKIDGFGAMSLKSEFVKKL